MTTDRVPRVSVIVPTLNRLDLLPQALASIRRQEGPDLELEIIVADNGLSDDTRRVAESFGALYIPVPERGAAAARNAGMRHATGEFIAFLDDDDVWLDGHLRPQIAMMQSDTRIGAVVAQVRNVDHNLSGDGPAWPAAFNSHSATAEFFRYYPQIGATVVRASILPTAGLFNRKLKGDEDWDWHFRLSRVTTIGFVDAPVVLFRQRPIDDGDLEWFRLPWFFRVYFANLLRVRDFRTFAVGCGSMARHLGGYCYFFLEVARTQLPLNRRRARTNLLRAIAASPAHAISLSLRSSEWRRVAVASLKGGGSVSP